MKNTSDLFSELKWFNLWGFETSHCRVYDKVPGTAYRYHKFVEDMPAARSRHRCIHCGWYMLI
jgi:hypothetical protein